MISREESHITLDPLLLLAKAIVSMQEKHPGERLVIFKSDVAQAFRNIPMAREWQILQVITTHENGRIIRNVDRTLCFGTRTAPQVYCTFHSCVLWIAEAIKLIRDLFSWMDDTYSVELMSKMLFYQPYGEWYPDKLTQFLLLLDELGIPHEKSKQLYGEKLVIIGLLVDTITMQISLLEDAKEKVLESIDQFIANCCRPLKDFLQLAGYLNWALTVARFLKPALRAL
jgi:hypothetical protein